MSAPDLLAALQRSIDTARAARRRETPLRVILCGNGCSHNHDAINGPTGCCDEHGPYMYFCNECHDRWRATQPTTTPNQEASTTP